VDEERELVIVNRFTYEAVKLLGDLFGVCAPHCATAAKSTPKLHEGVSRETAHANGCGISSDARNDQSNDQRQEDRPMSTRNIHDTTRSKSLLQPGSPASVLVKRNLRVRRFLSESHSQTVTLLYRIEAGLAHIWREGAGDTKRSVPTRRSYRARHRNQQSVRLDATDPRRSPRSAERLGALTPLDRKDDAKTEADHKHDCAAENERDSDRRLADEEREDESDTKEQRAHHADTGRPIR
jgi:hypothetical protein